MHSETVVVGEFEANCLILWAEPGAAWVVDPGADHERIRDVLRARGLAVGLYFLTHGHIDHLSALDGLLREWPAPVWLHAAEASWAFSAANRIAPYLHVPRRPESLRTDLAEGLEIAAGGLTARVLHTPGHSPGSVCLHFDRENRLVTGDTLFAGSVGRTDLPGGRSRALRTSLDRLARLPATCAVLPGHGPHTTIDQEIRTNPFLQGRS
jgi:glyoxylase-like metal-dependent hydrolase (beta-lactamase superfamily II)